MPNIKDTLRSISQGSQVPPERPVSQADIEQVPQVIGSRPGREALSQILKGGSIPANFIPGVGTAAGMGMYAAGEALDPNKTTGQKLSPGNVAMMGAPAVMGTMGKFAGMGDDVARLAQAEGLSGPEAQILAQRMPVRQAMQGMTKTAPTATERQLEKMLDFGPEAAKERLYQEFIKSKGSKATDQDIIGFWKKMSEGG